MKFNLNMFDKNAKVVVVESKGYESILQHSHEFVEISYIRSGSALHRVNNIEFDVTEGDLFIISHSEDVHCLRPLCKEEDFRIVNIIFDRSVPDIPLEELDHIISNFPVKGSIIVGIIKKIKKEYLLNDELSFEIIKNYINQILCEIKIRNKQKERKKRMK